MKYKISPGIIGLILTVFALPSAMSAPTLPQLSFPADCQPGKTCYIQLYVATETDKNVTDPGGNDLTNKNHTGTDIALSTYQQMDAGVNVLAAASGKVIRLRTDQDDHYNRNYQFDPKKSCGNGVLIDHGRGWQSQYCHLKKGSVVVTAGQTVKEGTVIGQIGSSGHADFPHLHFTVRRYDTVYDPFTKKLWSNPEITYTPTGLIDSGMADKSLKLQDVLNQPPRRTQFSLYDPAFVVWTRLYGVHAGDEQRFTFYQPNGQVYQQPIQTTISANYKEWFAFAGYPLMEKIPSDLAGKWRVEYQIKRGNADWQTLGQIDFTINS